MVGKKTRVVATKVSKETQERLYAYSKKRGKPPAVVIRELVESLLRIGRGEE